MAHKHALAITAGLLCAALSSAGLAFQPLITDDTGTQGKGGNQLEFSNNLDQTEAAGDTDTTRTYPVTYTRGLSDALDVYFSANYTRYTSTVPGNNASGSGNPSLGIKWRFYENEASKTSLAIKPELKLPVSAAKETAGLGTGRASYGLTLILTQETAFGAVHANLATGRNHYRDVANYPDPDVSNSRISIAPVWDVSEQWKLALEAGIETEVEANSSNRLRSNFFQIGAIFSPSKDLDLAFGILRRTDDEAPKTYTTSAVVGITWRFK